MISFLLSGFLFVIELIVIFSAAFCFLFMAVAFFNGYYYLGAAGFFICVTLCGFITQKM